MSFGHAMAHAADIARNKRYQILAGICAQLEQFAEQKDDQELIALVKALTAIIAKGP